MQASLPPLPRGPVYNGVFRIVPVDVVIEDIRGQVAAGAQHISFGDPDFFNGPAPCSRIVDALHGEFPQLTYDVTIKIEHLLRHAHYLPLLKRTGCLFITSAAESLQDAVLEKLDKGTREQTSIRAVALTRDAELWAAPTFILVRLPGPPSAAMQN